jgi:acyl-ACP thioesterase
MDSQKIPFWKDDYKIRSYHTGPRGRATLPALCAFMQESAWNHARHLGLGFIHLQSRGCFWVLSRQKIQIYRYPEWGETIRVLTWPSGRDRLYWYRDFRILGRDSTPVGLASTVWLILDIQTRRPVKTGTFQTGSILTEGAPVFSRPPEKIRSGDALEEAGQVQVSYSDLDVNGHVNNIRYIQWIGDALPPAFLRNHSLSCLTINYLNEVRDGETVRIVRQTVDNGGFLHELARKSDDTPICRSITEWSEEP